MHGTPPSAAAGSAIGDALNGLRAARADWRGRQERQREVASFPSRAGLDRVVELLAGALYPRRLGRFGGDGKDEDAFVAARLIAATTELAYWQEEARGGRLDPDLSDIEVRTKRP